MRCVVEVRLRGTMDHESFALCLLFVFVMPIDKHHFKCIYLLRVGNVKTVAGSTDEGIMNTALDRGLPRAKVRANFPKRIHCMHDRYS